jgi:hypothetical protein
MYGLYIFLNQKFYKPWTCILEEHRSKIPILISSQTQISIPAIPNKYFFNIEDFNFVLQNVQSFIFLCQSLTKTLLDIGFRTHYARVVGKIIQLHQVSLKLVNTANLIIHLQMDQNPSLK